MRRQKSMRVSLHTRIVSHRRSTEATNRGTVGGGRAADMSAHRMAFLFVGALVVAACGGNSRRTAGEDSPREGDALVLPTGAALVGEWRRDYVTAGTTSHHGRLHFEEGGGLVVDTESMTSLTEPPAVGHHSGSWEDSRPGAVKYAWGDSARSEAEIDLTFIQGRMLEEHPCCYRAFSDRWWTHRGYLAQSAQRTSFRRESLRRDIAADGTTTSYRHTSVELAFPSSPASLIGRDDCSLDVAAHLETLEDGALLARDFAITLPCTVTEDDFDVVVVLVPGWDTAEGASLLDYPYRARAVWQTLLAERGDTADWPDSLLGALWDAFEPYLAFDRARPDVLFHPIDANALAITGYARVQPSP